MKVNKNIRKFFLVLSWLMIGGAVLVLLVAAVNVKNRKRCAGLKIEITGVEEFYFLDKEDVKNTVASGPLASPQGKPITAFNLRLLEEKLERNVWVKDAELYFDNNMV